MADTGRELGRGTTASSRARPSTPTKEALMASSREGFEAGQAGPIGRGRRARLIPSAPSALCTPRVQASYGLPNTLFRAAKASRDFSQTLLN